MSRLVVSAHNRSPYLSASHLCLFSQAGMERKDVMSKNVAIYKAQAAALEKGAAPGCKVRWEAKAAGGCFTRRQELQPWHAALGQLHLPPHLMSDSPSSLRRPPCLCASLAGAGGGQPRQHQRPHPQGERALHPRG